MALRISWSCIAICSALLARSASCLAQDGDARAVAEPSLCGIPVPPPASLPPTNLGPVVYYMGLCFEAQRNVSTIEPETYLSYIHLQPSRPSQNAWYPYNDETERTALDDFKRLWATGFLDDLSIELADYQFGNGVVGKIVTYHLEERQRIKNVTYETADGKAYNKDGLDRTKIEEKLREQTITIRLDSFVDSATEVKVANAVREMLVDKGYQDATVDPKIEPLPGSPKTVNLAFKITEGPKVKISGVDFIGNTVFDDGALKKKMKQNKGGGFWIFHGSGVYQEDKFEEDAERLTQFYREHGYIEVNVGEPELKKIKDSSDGKTRHMTLQVPVTEGRRFKVGDVSLDGNTKVPPTALRPLFKLKTGDYYNEKQVRDGFDKSKEILRRGRVLRNGGVSRVVAGRSQRAEGCEGSGRERQAEVHGRQAVLRQPRDVRRKHPHEGLCHPA